MSTAPARLHQPAIPNTLTVVRDFDQWLKAQTRSDATRRNYVYAVLRFLAETCPADLAEVTEQDVVAFLNGLGRKGPARWAYRRSLGAFFRWALRRGYVTTDPTADLAPKKPAMKPPETLTRDDMTRLLVAAAWRNPQRAWALMLTYSIGARRMEVAAIRPEDVDLEGRTVYLATTKGDRPRRVELGPLALAALEGLRPWGKTVVGVGAATLHAWMNVAAQDADLPRAKWKLHGLRATFATDLLDRGTPISVVSTLLGHRDLTTTARYLGIRPEDRRKAVETL
jgi:site-specific recombinase XerD